MVCLLLNVLLTVRLLYMDNIKYELYGKNYAELIALLNGTDLCL